MFLHLEKTFGLKFGYNFQVAPPLRIVFFEQDLVINKMPILLLSHGLDLLDKFDEEATNSNVEESVDYDHIDEGLEVYFSRHWLACNLLFSS